MFKVSIDLSFISICINIHTAVNNVGGSKLHCIIYRLSIFVLLIYPDRGQMDCNRLGKGRGRRETMSINNFPFFFLGDCCKRDEYVLRDARGEEGSYVLNLRLIKKKIYICRDIYSYREKKKGWKIEVLVDDYNRSKLWTNP